MSGILLSATNSGLDSEIAVEFSTPLSVISNQPVFVSEAASLKQTVTSMNVQRWEIEANLMPTNSSENALIHSVGSGYHQVMYLRMPQVYRINKNPIDVATVSLGLDNLRGSTAIALVGNASVRVGKGEFINIGNDPKVYLVVGITTDGSAAQIRPSLRTNVNAGDLIKYGKYCTMAARYDSSSVLGIKYTDGVMSDPGSVKFIEAL